MFDLHKIQEMKEGRVPGAVIPTPTFLSFSVLVVKGKERKRTASSRCSGSDLVSESLSRPFHPIKLVGGKVKSSPTLPRGRDFCLCDDLSTLNSLAGK